MNNSAKVHRLTQLAILVAIIFLLSFTPLGYLAIGPIAATTVQMPVIIGAILMGPAAGAILGFFFGLSAIIKVLTTGADQFAVLALTHSPAAYLTVCFGARILMGFLTGLLAGVLKKIPAMNGKGSFISYGITGFIGSGLNTVFYLGMLWALCAEVISSFYGVDLAGVGALVTGTAYAAGIPEAFVSCIVVCAVCKAVEKSSLLIRHQPA